MTEPEIKSLIQKAAEEAADKTLREVFAIMRVDRSDLDSVTAFGDDLRYLRKQREAAEQISFKAMLGILGTASTGLLAILWLGLQEFFGK